MRRLLILCLLPALILVLLSGGHAAAQTPTPSDAGDTVHLPLITSPPPDTSSVVLLPLVRSPSPIANPWPANDAQRQSLNTYLTWDLANAGAAWANATYSVYLEPDDATPDQLLAVGLAKTNYDPATFEEDRLYYWQVVAERPDGQRSVGPVWHFRTDYFPAEPELGSMVYIPAGEFQMGCDPQNTGGRECNGDSIPLHPVYLDAFFMDKYEVTNIEYATCVAAGACQMPRRTSLLDIYYFGAQEYNLFPVIYVSHWDAEDYCGWAGKRIPTEAEWEKAARGAIDTRPWPWGSEGYDCSNLNRCRTSDDWFTARVDDFHRNQSPYGVVNLAGNVAEWLQDFYNPTYYYNAPYANPVNTHEWEEQAGRMFYSIRGGSFHDNWFYSRTSYRKFGHWGDDVGDASDRPFYRSFRVGIRCAKDAE